MVSSGPGPVSPNTSPGDQPGPCQCRCTNLNPWRSASASSSSSRRNLPPALPDAEARVWSRLQPCQLLVHLLPAGTRALKRRKKKKKSAGGFALSCSLRGWWGSEDGGEVRRFAVEEQRRDRLRERLGGDVQCEEEERAEESKRNRKGLGSRV
eukprot:2515323-Rhodomonas_salina.1